MPILWWLYFSKYGGEGGGGRGFLDFLEGVQCLKNPEP